MARPSSSVDQLPKFVVLNMRKEVEDFLMQLDEMGNGDDYLWEILCDLPERMHEWWRWQDTTMDYIEYVLENAGVHPDSIEGDMLHSCILMLAKAIVRNVEEHGLLRQNRMEYYFYSLQNRNPVFAHNSVEPK